MTTSILELYVQPYARIFKCSRDGEFIPPIWKMFKEYETIESKMINYNKNQKISYLEDFFEI